MKATLLIAVLTFSPLTLFAAAGSQSDLKTFLDHFSNPEDSDVSPQLKNASRASVSMGHGKGSFLVPLQKQLLSQKLLDASGITLENFLSLHYGGGFSWKSDSETKDLWLIPGYESVLKALKKLNVVAGEIRWQALNGERDERDQPGFGNCSGFLVGAKYVMTNEHCLSTQEKCNIVDFRFNEELEPDGKTLKPIDSYPCRRVIVSDPELDFSLVELEGEPGRKWTSLTLAARDPVAPHSVWKSDFLFIGHDVQVPGEPVTVMGHPGVHPEYPGGAEFKTIKKITKTCSVSDSVSRIGIGVDFEHYNFPFFNWEELIRNHKLKFELHPTFEFSLSCASTGGGSGSAVLDRFDNVIGIFNLGSGGYQNLSGGKAVPISRIYRRYKREFDGLGIRVLEGRE